jgi:hypothetical protein
VVSQSHENSPSFWRPFILHPVVIIIFISVAGAVIAALEVTSLYSDEHHGWQGSLNSNFWTYALPAFLLLLGIITLRYVSALATVEQFEAMNSDPLPAKRALEGFAFVTTPLVGLWTGAQRRYFALAVSGLGVLWLISAGILTSVLFVEKDIMSTKVVDLQQLSTFVDVPTSSLSQQSNVAERFVLNQLPNTDLQPPPWTTSQAAIGAANLSTLMNIEPGTTLVSALPAVMAELTGCVSMIPADFSLSPQGLFTLAQPQRGCPTLGVGNATVFRAGFRGWFGATAPADCAGGLIGVFGKVADDGSLQNVTVARCEGDMKR